MWSVRGRKIKSDGKGFGLSSQKDAAAIKMEKTMARVGPGQCLGDQF